MTLEDFPGTDPRAAPGNALLPMLLPLPSCLPGTRAFCSSCLFPVPIPSSGDPWPPPHKLTAPEGACAQPREGDSLLRACTLVSPQSMVIILLA